MADLEKRVEKLEDKFPTLEKQINTLATKVDMFISEMRDFKAEMREQNKIRFDKNCVIDSKFDKLINKIRNMTVAMIFVAVCAIICGIVVKLK